MELRGEAKKARRPFLVFDEYIHEAQAMYLTRQTAAPNAWRAIGKHMANQNAVVRCLRSPDVAREHPSGAATRQSLGLRSAIREPDQLQDEDKLRLPLRNGGLASTALATASLGSSEQKGVPTMLRLISILPALVRLIAAQEAKTIDDVSYEVLPTPDALPIDDLRTVDVPTYTSTPGLTAEIISYVTATAVAAASVEQSETPFSVFVSIN
nr:hypothetical protein CFP56_65484 [Quercus suber]